MYWINQISRTKILLILLAIAISSVFLISSQALVRDLSEQERTNMSIWAEAMRTLNHADENTDLSLVLKVINSNSSIPVISRDNRYVGTVSEGDFLWYLVDGIKGAEKTYDIRDTETIRLSDVLRIDKNPPVRIDTKPDALIERACQQNFIPVVDDRECFIGIVTRKAIIESLSVKKEDAGSTTISYGYAPARK